MPSAEIIAIGTELLLGEIQDTNTQYLARRLRDHGINLFRTTMIGDNLERVAEAVNESLSRADIVITTGGLGPTVDDPTRDAIAFAFGVETEYHPELWEQIVNRFSRFHRTPTENNKRQAYVPQGGIAVENPVGTAPCFIMEKDGKCVFTLPGVPKEMEYLTTNALLPYLITTYNLHEIIKAQVLHTIGLGESTVDDKIGDLELLTNPTVGLLAKSGQVDIRITAKAESEEEADILIANIAQMVRDRLGAAIYGVDGETIEDVIMGMLVEQHLGVHVYLDGIDQEYVANRMGILLNKQVMISPFQGKLPQAHDGMIDAVVQMEAFDKRHEIVIRTKYGQYENEINRSYGGPHQLASLWAVNALFASLYQYLVQQEIP
jgi:competence/damage-inducible protein CinA-like protein